MSIDNNTPLIELKNISYQYSPNSKKVLKDINLKIFKGEMMAIVGPNGGGKTTLLKIILQLVRASHGVVQRLQKCKVSYVPQVSELNSLLPLRTRDVLELSRHPDFLHHPLIELFQLHNKLEAAFFDLSPGEKQRVLIAKATLENPELLILDEPLTGIDTLGQDQIMQLLSQLKEVHKMGVLMIEHHLPQILKYADRLLCLNQTVHWHDSAEFFNSKVLAGLYHCEFEHLLQHQHGHYHG